MIDVGVADGPFEKNDLHLDNVGTGGTFKRLQRPEPGRGTGRRTPRAPGQQTGQQSPDQGPPWTHSATSLSTIPASCPGKGSGTYRAIRRGARGKSSGHSSLVIDHCRTGVRGSKFRILTSD